MTHTYEIIRSGIDGDGWFKFWLRRDDGREIRASRKRVAQLRKSGQLPPAPSVGSVPRHFEIDR